jgi:hypothetical protein
MNKYLDALADGGAEVGDGLDDLGRVVVRLSVVHPRDPVVWGQVAVSSVPTFPHCIVVWLRICSGSHLRRVVCTFRRASTRASRSLYSARAPSAPHSVNSNMDTPTLRELSDIVRVHLPKALCTSIAIISLTIIL